jgi:hypothetical protein
LESEIRTCGDVEGERVWNQKTSMRINWGKDNKKGRDEMSREKAQEKRRVSSAGKDVKNYAWVGRLELRRCEAGLCKKGMQGVADVARSFG